jgi:hypothetical protein
VEGSAVLSNLVIPLEKAVCRLRSHRDRNTKECVTHSPHSNHPDFEIEEETTFEVEEETTVIVTDEDETTLVVNEEVETNALVDEAIGPQTVTVSVATTSHIPNAV